MAKLKKYIYRFPKIVFLPLALAVGASLGLVSPKKDILDWAFCLAKFEEAKKIIQAYYLEETSDSLLIAGALDGLMSSLDPYTWYISQEQFQKISERLESNYVGVGIYTKSLQDTVYITHVIPYSPAHKAGLLAGDRILSIDNKRISGKESDTRHLSKLLRGANDTWVRIQIKRRKKRRPIEFAVKRATIPNRSVVYSALLQEKTGVIKLQSFARRSAHEVRYHLEMLKAQGMENLILDLRDNGGGFLDVCNELTDMFLSEGKVMTRTQGRAPQHSRTYLATSDIQDFETGNLVILINENSASASELLAGAIQDNDRGYVLGRCSYGKGLVQNQYILQDRSAVRITVARYYTPCGRYVQKPFREKKLLSSNPNSIKSLEEVSTTFYENLPDSLRYLSFKGRRIVGEGGILPDIYLPPDSTRQSPELREMLKNDLFDVFVLHNLAVFENTLKKYPHISFFESRFSLPKNFSRKFLIYAANRLQKPYSRLAYLADQPELELYLKSSIAWIYFGPEGYYRARASLDGELQKALQTIADPQVMNNLQLSYPQNH